MAEIGSDGLTDAERAEYAERWRNGAGKMPDRETMRRLRELTPVTSGEAYREFQRTRWEEPVKRLQDEHKAETETFLQALGYADAKVEFTEAPPIGLKPRWLVAEERLLEVEAAIGRYQEAGLEIPLEWITERFDLYDIVYRARF